MTPYAYARIQAAVERIEAHRQAISQGNIYLPHSDNTVIGRTVVADCTPGNDRELYPAPKIYNFSKVASAPKIHNLKRGSAINFYNFPRSGVVSNWVMVDGQMMGMN